MSKDYNSGLDTAARIVEEVIGGTSEGATILCGIESSKNDSENNYCETCGSCGETGCCPPINCQAVKCKYGEINLKDYDCLQKQWGIMYNALNAIKNNKPPSLEDLNNGTLFFTEKELADIALTAVDKEWDKCVMGS